MLTTTISAPAYNEEDDATIRIIPPECLIGIPSHEPVIGSWVEFTDKCTEEGRFFLCRFTWCGKSCAAVLRTGFGRKPTAHWHPISEWFDEQHASCSCPERYIGGCDAQSFFALLLEECGSPTHASEHAIGTAVLSA